MARSRSAPNDNSPRLRPVILSGGSGTRLWPLSRKLCPKQLLPLGSERSLFQDTVIRVADPNTFSPPVVVCNEEHRFIIAEQLQELDTGEATIILEPVGRNTAPAAALAAALAEREDPESLLLILPADHVVADTGAFVTAAELARHAAVDGWLVTFGILPRRPETGYGYIKRGAVLENQDEVYRVDQFIEKPDARKATSLLASDDYLWNSGMFLFRADVYLGELSRLQPDMIRMCRQAVDRGAADLDFFRPDAKAFSASPAESIDVAVMEHTDKAVVVPADMGWNDVGTWAALWEIGNKDSAGNVLVGDVLVEDVKSSYIRGDGCLVVAAGLDGVVLVATDDAVLATKLDHAQGVRNIVATLEKNARDEAVSHPTVVRPWGQFQTLDAGDRFQVKRITVKPGAALSLQKHKHRAEHWVVVRGTARVTLGKDVFDLQENQSTYIPVGEIHRLENCGGEPLELIEVQSGDYLGEDDIERIEDVYGRAE